MPARFSWALRGIAVALVMLASAEVAARVDDWIRLGIPLLHTPDYDHDLKYQDWFGVRGKPFGRYRRWRLDNYGFRGPDIAKTPSPNCTRLMILGASETFGLYESDNREYPAQLRDSLAKRGCYEVINAAIAGAGLQGMIRLWENYAAQFKPAMVLVYPSPTFYLTIAEPDWKPVPGKAAPLDELPFRPRLIEQFKNAWETPQFIQRRRIERWIANDTAGKPADWFFQDVPIRRVDAFMRDLDSLVKSIKASGARPVLMTHAMKFTIPPKESDADLLRSWRQFNPRASTQALLGIERMAAQRVREYGAANSVCVVDIDRSLTGHAEDFADFVHFTDQGSALVSGAIAHRVVDEGCSPSNDY